VYQLPALEDEQEDPIWIDEYQIQSSKSSEWVAYDAETATFSFSPASIDFGTKVTVTMTLQDQHQLDPR
jgi:hypothetical protein